MKPMSENQMIAGFAAALVCIVALIYAPTLSSDFTADSRSVVLANDYVHHLGNLPDALTFGVMRRDVMDNNRPYYLASAILDWAIWGPNPFGHHLTNLLLHAAVTLLLFLLCRKLLAVPRKETHPADFEQGLLQDAPTWIAFAVSLLFAAHPINTEAVAEISCRKDLIAGAGILGALYFATFFQPRMSGRNFAFAIGCLVCTLIAVAAKENGAAAAPALVAYWFLFRRKQDRRAGWLALCGAALFVTAAFLAARFALPPVHSHIFTDKPMPLGRTIGQTLNVQARIWTFYFRQIVYPHALSADYGPDSIRGFSLRASIGTLIAVLLIQIILGWRNRLFALGAALFWLALLPASNLFPQYKPVADRFLYAPLLGVALMLGSFHYRRLAWFGPFAAVYLVLAAATVAREMVWHNEITLWSDTFEKNPKSEAAANNLAYAYLAAGSPQRAIEPGEQAIRLSGGKSADAFAGVAIALDETGNHLGADAQYEMAVNLDPRYGHPQELVGDLRTEQKFADRLEILRARRAAH